MPQEFDLQSALKLAAQTEKNVMDFYKRAASIAKNPKAKKVFELLAKEEMEHVSHVFPLYEGDDLGTFDEFINRPPHPDTVTLKALEKILTEDIPESKAMELALREEEDLAKNLRLTAAKIVDPVVKQVFERLAKETEHHFAIIESEYAHIMGMVHETDIDTYVRE